MIAALYVERGGVYWDMPDVDPWDEARDAYTRGSRPASSATSSLCTPHRPSVMRCSSSRVARYSRGVAHFPNLPPDARRRLDMRGLDPEQSYIAWLEAILDGSFPLTVEGLPKRPEGRPGRRARALSPIPLAIVLP